MSRASAPHLRCAELAQVQYLISTVAMQRNLAASEGGLRRVRQSLHQAELGEQPELVIVGVVGDDLLVTHSRDIGKPKIDRGPGRFHVAIFGCERSGVGAGETSFYHHRVAGFHGLLDDRACVRHRALERLEVLAKDDVSRLARNSVMKVAGPPCRTA
jgi:hypothetical protein